MSTFFRSTLVAGSALLAVGAALAQEPGESQSQEKMDRSSTSTKAQSDDSGTSERAGAMDSQGQDKKSQTSRQARAGGGAPPVMMMLLVPVTMEKQTDTALADGCWAKLYDDYSYGGDSLTLVGPLDLPKMIGPFGVDWDDKVSSIKTGPKAMVTIYDNENYRDRAAKIKPAQEVPELTEKMGLFEEPNSIRISCAETSRTAAD